MSFLTPRKLSSLAAKVFVEDLLLESLLFLNEIWVDPKRPDEQIKFQFKHNEKENVHSIVQFMDEILKKCTQTTLDTIVQVLRSTDHYCFSGVVILQFLYDTEVNIRKQHWIMIPILTSIKYTYNSIEKLVFDSWGDQRIISLFTPFLKYLPNLKIFKCLIMKEVKFLTSLRTYCPKLTQLTLWVKEGFFTSNQLAAFFFSGKSLEYVKRAFVKLESVPLSFPDLEDFSMSLVGYEQYDFFKMFLHFYTKVNFQVGLHYSHLYFNTVSWFDAVLSHSVIINPELRVSQCELNIYDLFLPFCEKSLESWKNLESLLISVGIRGKKIHATSTSIGKRLESLLSKHVCVKDLVIKIQGPVSDDEVAEILLPSFKAHGKKLFQLKVLGLVHFLSHRSLAQVLSLCPNIKQLTLVGMGKRIMKYVKDIKLKPLSNLESLTVLWPEVQTDANYCQWVSRIASDLIRNSPNLKSLHCTANGYLIEYMSKMNFGSELEELVIYFQTENSFDGMILLKKILPRLSNLNQLVVAEGEMNEMCCNCFLTKKICLVCSIYRHVKSFVKNTQINTRYYSFDDFQITMYL